MRGVCLLLLCALMPVDAALSESALKWQQHKGRHFVIYYRDVPQNFLDTVMETAEEYFSNISSTLGASRSSGWSQDNRAQIYIYRDQQDYIENGGQAGWSHGAALVGEKIIRTYPSDSGFFDSLLPHELGHIILHEYLGPYADIPLWFDEGVAMYQEKARRLGADSQVREAIAKGQFIPLNELTNMRLYRDTDQDTVQLFYAESASVVNFLISRSEEHHFRHLLRELQNNTRFEDALSKAYLRIRSLDDLNKMWLRHLQGE